MKSKRNPDHSVAMQRLIGMALATALAGCTTMQLPDYQAAPSVTATSRTAEERGLSLTVDPFFEPARTERYFGLDALHAGIVILYVHFANQSSDATYLLQKDNFKLLLNASDETGPGATSNIERRSAAGEAMLLTGAALTSLPLVFVGAKMISNASVVQNNFTSKELGNQTLSPGETMEGFVYYQLPEKQRLANGARFVAVAVKTADQETVHFELPLFHEN